MDDESQHNLIALIAAVPPAFAEAGREKSTPSSPRLVLAEAGVKRYHYDSHKQLEAHLHDFIDAYNYGRRLKTLKGLTPFEYICKIWTIEPERYILNPTHQMPRLNT